MEFPNVTEVRQRAQKDWESAFKKRLSIQERIRESVPWWLVIVAFVFFALSVPHTANVFNKITPGWGKLAPLGIEFGLLYAAFRRRVGKHTFQLIVLEVLLFITAIIVNGAGSLEAVVNSTGEVQGLSMSELIAQIGELPATSQVAIILVPIAAFIIPIGTVSAGEGLAALALEFRERGNALLDEWQKVQQDIEFMALRDAAINGGHTPKKAIRWARDVVGMDTGGQTRTTGRMSAIGQPDIKTDKARNSTGHGYTKNMSAVEQANAYLDENGDPGVTVREFADLVGIGKTTAADVLRDYRTNGSGADAPGGDE